MAQLSDLHLGHVEVEHIRHSVEITNQLGADIVVLTGDFVAGSETLGAPCARELAALKARHGVYAVLGNHDVWTEADVIAGQLAENGITVLRNQKTSLQLGGERLWLLGVEDAGYTGFSDSANVAFEIFRKRWQPTADLLGQMVRDIPESEPRLLLVHNPDLTEMLPPGRFDLALCGHTHGGQIVLPGLGAPVVPSCFGQKYVSGLVEGRGLPVYVNRGVGVAGLRVRFNCRPEITLLELG